jgi:DNA-directed RNA polymerase subunit M/transcription elongation factor TFIIS
VSKHFLDKHDWGTVVSVLCPNNTVAFAPMLKSKPSGDFYVPGGAAGAEKNTLHGCDRARARAALLAVLPFGPEEQEAAEAYAYSLEACVVAMADNLYSRYITIMSRVTWNMSTNGARIVETFPIAQVCHLSHQCMGTESAHERRKKSDMVRVNAILARAAAEADRAAAMASTIVTEAIIKCPKCKATDRIHRIAVQRNAGDEGMKTECLCHCGYRWELAG